VVYEKIVFYTPYHQCLLDYSMVIIVLQPHYWRLENKKALRSLPYDKLLIIFLNDYRNIIDVDSLRRKLPQLFCSVVLPHP